MECNTVPWLVVGVNVEWKVKRPTQYADKATEFDLNLMESKTRSQHNVFSLLWKRFKFIYLSKDD